MADLAISVGSELPESNRLDNPRSNNANQGPVGLSEQISRPRVLP